MLRFPRLLYLTSIFFFHNDNACKFHFVPSLSCDVSDFPEAVPGCGDPVLDREMTEHMCSLDSNPAFVRMLDFRKRLPSYTMREVSSLSICPVCFSSFSSRLSFGCWWCAVIQVVIQIVFLYHKEAASSNLTMLILRKLCQRLNQVKCL